MIFPKPNVTQCLFRKNLNLRMLVWLEGSRWPGAEALGKDTVRLSHRSAVHVNGSEV